jgi:O-antigen/teichoic acid export membrane protein
MARAHGTGDITMVRRHADVTTRALLVLLAPLFAAALLLAPEVLALFGGGTYADGAGVLRILLVATYVAVVPVAAVNALSSGDGVRVPVYSAVAGAAAGLLALVALGRFGATGVGVSYLIAVATTTIHPVVVVWRRYRMAWAGVTVRCLAVLLGALVVAQLAEARSYGSARIVIDILSAVLVAVAASLLLRRDIAAVLAARHAT